MDLLIIESIGKNGRVVLIFDGDKPGRNFTEQVASKLVNRVLQSNSLP